MRELKMFWQLLWSIPLCVGVVLVYFLLMGGWGISRADKFLKHWNKFAADEAAPLEIG